MLVSDLENLASSAHSRMQQDDGKQSMQSTVGEDSNITYDYFLCVKKNDLIYDIDGGEEADSLAYRQVAADQ